MRTLIKHLPRERLNERGARGPRGGALPDGAGGTITGGPMKPLDLMEILSRGGCGASAGGAVSGAAQAMTVVVRKGGDADRGIALSDGSRIFFVSVDDGKTLVEA